MKLLLFRLVVNTSGYGFVFVLSHHSSVLGIYISEERNMLVVEKFIRSLVDKYGRHTVYTDGGTWYPEACNILKLKHYLHSSFEKSLMERASQSIF